jgi:hypothetical protein
MKKALIPALAVVGVILISLMVNPGRARFDGMKPIYVAGTLVDDVLGTPIRTADIAFRQAEGEPPWGQTVSKDDGSFEMAVKGWIYHGTEYFGLWREAWYYPFRLQISAPGYKETLWVSDELPAHTTNSKADRLTVGTITLTPITPESQEGDRPGQIKESTQLSP